MITTNSSSIPEVGGDAVVYIEPGNAEQLAAEIDRLVSDDTIREEYIDQGLRRSTEFSWNKTAELTEEVYQAIV